MAIEDRIRVTHHEREAAAEELRAAYAVGCLDDDELEGWVSHAYTAKTRGDLTALVYDLPVVTAPGDARHGQAMQPTAADWRHRARAALGLAPMAQPPQHRLLAPRPSLSRPPPVARRW